MRKNDFPEKSGRKAAEKRRFKISDEDKRAAGAIKSLAVLFKVYARICLKGRTNKFYGKTSFLSFHFDIYTNSL